MGVDHTLFAVAPGWVRFYQPEPEPRQPAPALASPRASSSLRIKPVLPQTALPKTEPLKCHPSSARRKLGKRYVGIALSQDAILPRPHGTPRDRLFDKIDIVAFEEQREAFWAQQKQLQAQAERENAMHAEAEAQWRANAPPRESDQEAEALMEQLAEGIEKSLEQEAGNARV